MPNSVPGSCWKERCERRQARERSASDSGVRRGRVHDRCWAPLPARDVRGRVGRQLLRVDRDLGPALLQEPRAGQAHGAAAEDGEALLSRLPGLLHRQLGAAPGERDPAAAVAVVVDDRLLAQLLRAHHEAGRSKRPQADDGADDPVLGDAHARQTPRWHGPDGRPASAARASGKTNPESGEPAGLKHHTPRHRPRDHGQCILCSWERQGGGASRGHLAKLDGHAHDTRRA